MLNPPIVEVPRELDNKAKHLINCLFFYLSTRRSNAQFGPRGAGFVEKSSQRLRSSPVEVAHRLDHIRATWLEVLPEALPEALREALREVLREALLAACQQPPVIGRQIWGLFLWELGKPAELEELLGCPVH